MPRVRSFFFDFLFLWFYPADGFSCRLAAAAARVPQLEEDLRAARAQCAESEKAVQAAAVKARETDGELARLRRLEANHLVELEAAKRVGREEVENLKKRLEEVDQQRLKLRDEVTSKSNELSATAKRWVSEISALDRGLAGESLHLFLPFAGFRLSAAGLGWQPAAETTSAIDISIFRLGAGGVSRRLPPVYFFFDDLHLQAF